MKRLSFSHVIRLFVFSVVVVDVVVNFYVYIWAASFILHFQEWLPYKRKCAHCLLLFIQSQLHSSRRHHRLLFVEFEVEFNFVFVWIHNSRMRGMKVKFYWTQFGSSPVKQFIIKFVSPNSCTCDTNIKEMFNCLPCTKKMKWNAIHGQKRVHPKKMRDISRIGSVRAIIQYVYWSAINGNTGWLSVFQEGEKERERKKKESNHLFLCIDFDRYLSNECRRCDKWHTIYRNTHFVQCVRVQFFRCERLWCCLRFFGVKQMKISHLKQMRNM